MSDRPPIARRMAEIQPFHVMELLGRARELEAQGRSIIHMEIGEPDFPTPAPVVEAGQRALAEGRTRYTPALGLPELREAISRFYAGRFGVEVPARRIVVTPGASGALLLALATLVNPGDKVLLTDPGYPCNRHFVRVVEGEPVAIPVSAADHFELQAAHVERHWDSRTVAAMVATPSNPTGTVLGKAALQRIADAVRRRGGCLIVDEIYQGLTYDVEPVTALALGDDLFVINSFSKYFSMTGWRLGWVVVPEPYVRDVEKLAQNLFIAPPTVSQHAAIAAFQRETIAILEGYRAEFRHRRDYLLSRLQHLGFQVPVVPEGAFYIYAGSAAFGSDSFDLSRRFLETAGVAVTPGLDFGHYQAASHLRFACTRPLAELEEGCRRIEDLLAR